MAENAMDERTNTGARRKGSSIIRVLTLLEHIARCDGPVTPTELNRGLRWPKPTIHRLCATLESTGFLQRTLDGRRYTAGPRLRALAVRFLEADEQQVLMHSVLERVSRKIGETANISVPEQGQMRYLARVETQWPLRLQLPVGSQVPLHCTSAGKLYLSSLSAAARSRLLKTLTLERLTPKTITERAALETALEEAAARGFSTDDEEFIEGMVAVAVPVKNREGRLVAALAIHAPVVRMSLADAIDWVPELRNAADELVAQLMTASGENALS